MTILLDKKRLRLNAMEKRNSMAKNGVAEIKSQMIISKILNSDDFKFASNIALYFPIKNEIDITSILNTPNKKFYLPRCNNSDLEFCEYLGNDSLKIGNFGIFEPVGHPINPSILDLIYVPALMANKNNYRLGYGKGFYDRFFRNNNVRAKKIIVLASELISDDFIEDDFDIPCDMILSEK